MRRNLALFFALLLTALSSWAQQPFMAVNPDIKDPTPISLSRDAKPTPAVRYLQDGIRRMTGKTPEIQNSGSQVQGFVLATLDTAPADLKNDAEIKAALQADPKDPTIANDAYFIRSEPQRVVVIANTQSGLNAGVAALLESVDYEVLGMGLDWIHVPDYKNKPLLFTIKEAGRPGVGLRSILSPSLTGALTQEDLTNPEWKDVEPAQTSVERWLVGSRLRHQSTVEALPNHRMAVVEAMVRERSEAGFLTAKTTIGPVQQRPAATPANKRHLWIVDAPRLLIYYSDGNQWIEMTHYPWTWSLFEFDLSVPLVREVILNVMQEQAAKFWAENPGEIFYFRPEPTDNQAGHANFDQYTKNKNWYLEEIGRPYPQLNLLYNFNGIMRTHETWEPGNNDATNTFFALHSWLLRKFDLWIDSLPADQKNTGGKPKKERVRTLLTSTLYSDTLPTFNPDKRIQVVLTSSGWHRGRGEAWQKFASWKDLVKPFQMLLPGLPISFACVAHLPAGEDPPVPSHWANLNAVALLGRIKELREAGIQGVSVKIDLNFGRNGLYYYLLSKVLWNPNMSAEQLDALRDRWLQRAFGSGWEEMKVYYDYVTPRNFNCPMSLQRAKIIHWINTADKKAANEPAARRRIDTAKQLWYYHLLAATPSTREMEEFYWKGQSSYAVSMGSLGRLGARWNVSGDIYTDNPPRYTRQEIDAWWGKMLEVYLLPVLSEFENAIIADGTKGSDVDLNDLVTVGQFGAAGEGGQVWPTSMGANPFIVEAKFAGDVIGFMNTWCFSDHYAFGQFDIYYGVSRWDPETRQWRELIDSATNFQTSQHIDTKVWHNHGVVVRYTAPQPGAYRFNMLPNASYSSLFPLDTHIPSQMISGRLGATFSHQIYFAAATFYIPKGTWQLALETVHPPDNGDLVVQLHRGVPAWGTIPSRTINISERGYHTIRLNPGEDGSVATVVGRGSLWLLSIPHLWAGSATSLLVPRAIAKADGLTILSDEKVQPAPTPDGKP